MATALDFHGWRLVLDRMSGDGLAGARPSPFFRLLELRTRHEPNVQVKVTGFEGR
jgi:hypothetical protein